MTITPAPAASISYTGGPFCTTSGPVTVNQTGTTGGTYSYTGSGTLALNAGNGTITPASSTGGTYTVIYTIPAGNGCAQATTNTSVTITPAPTAVAGTAVSTCANTGAVNVTAGASATGYSSVLWTSSGTGTFANANSLTTATYTPSAADISAGSVTLTLQANGNGNCGSVTSTKTLTINPVPSITVTPATTTMCKGDIQALVASSASGTNNQTITVPSNTINVNIPDATTSGGGWGGGQVTYGEANTSLSVSGIPANAVITNVSITLNVSHNNDGDLNFNIKGPNGSILNLVNNQGGSGNNFTNTVISKNGSTQFFSANAPFTGTFAPDASFNIGPSGNRSNASSFTNIIGNNSGNGTWTLYAEDVNDNNTGGTINNWTIAIDYYIPQNNPVTWSPQTDLYTDAGATTPYTGQALTTVYAKPSTSGTIVYTATATNSGGCTNSAQATLTVSAAPVVSVTADYCAVQGKVVLTATSDVGGTYLWGDGETTNTVQVDEAGDYFVTVTGPTGCKGYGVISVAQELVTNGDFESGGISPPTSIGFTSDYTFKPDLPGLVPAGQGELYNDSGTNGYSITPNGQNVHINFWGHDHTTGHGNFMAINGHGDVIRVWKETVNVLPNTIYYFSAWAMSLNSAGHYAQLRFSVNGQLVGTTATLTGHGESNNATDNWIRFYGTWTSGPTTTTADIYINDLNSDLPGNDFGLDDVSFGTLSTFIRLVSDPGTDEQTPCVNTPITPIVYSVGSTASGPTITGLPPGLTTSFNGVLYTITGTPTTPGSYTYTISTAGTCNQPSTATGTITVKGDQVTLSSGNASPTVCVNDPVNIGFTLGGTATGINTTLTSLPAGFTGTLNGNTYTVSGSTATAGVYPYTIVTSGGCNADTARGIITVNTQTITLNSNNNNQTSCINTPIENIQYTIGGTATGASITAGGLPTGVTFSVNSGIIFISGTPTQSGTFNYTITTYRYLCDRNGFRNNYGYT